MNSTPLPSRVKPRSLTVAFFNAAGLLKQRDEVFEFAVEHSVDIFLIQETFLKPSNRGPRMANYNIVRNDRDGRGGGTLIYYKRSLHCVPLDPPPLAELEASVCRLGMTGHAPLTIASVYLSPNKNINQPDLEALFAMGDAVILAGDFNSRHAQWSCNRSNRNGRVLSNLSESMLFDILVPMTPTHYPLVAGHAPSSLDLALLKNVSLRMRSIETIHALSSDHRPVVLQLGPAADSTPVTKLVTDWDKLEKLLESTDSQPLSTIPDVIASPHETVAAVDALSSHLTNAISESSRRVPVMPDHRFKLPDDARELLRAKNAATRAHDSYPTADNRARMRCLQRAVKQRMRDLRSTRWEGLLEEISPSHQAYWKLARTFKSDTVTVLPPLKKPDNSIAFDDDEKAECLADSLESQCSPSTLPVNQDHVVMVDNEVDRLSSLAPTAILSPVTEDEVQTLIRQLKPRSAPGSDGISNKILKILPAQLICLLAAIFNSAMTNAIFPSAWKEADVIGIHKPGKDKSVASSYRPISLLKSLGKLYERVLVARLKDFVFTNNILIDEQFGFRPKHSCTHQLHRLTEHILRGLNGSLRPRGTGALFFDVAKAFDKVWHNGLLYKLYKLGVPDRLVHIIRDYLSDRTFRFRVEGTRSSPRPIRAGVPQGSVLSPLLFSLYVNDIPRTPRVELALFADDTALYTTDRDMTKLSQRLQSAATTLGDWFRLWRIEVNPEKSAAIHFHRGSSGLRPTPIRLFDRVIPWKSQVKYLGVIFDSRLTFAPHIQAIRNRAAFILGRLYHLVGRRSKMSLRNKTTIYKACIRPVMTYASVVFAHAANSHLHRLQNVQNRFMRGATAAPWYLRNVDLHRDLDLPTVRSFMKDASQAYFDKALSHPNPLVAGAANYDVGSFRPQRGPRRRFPRHVLDDPDDAITIANAPKPDTTHPATLNLHTSLGPRHRTRRISVRRPGSHPPGGRYIRNNVPVTRVPPTTR